MHQDANVVCNSSPMIETFQEAAMQLPRMTVGRWVIVAVAVAVALGIPGRQAAKSRCRSQAGYRSRRQQDHLGCITEDLMNALACARQAARGATIPRWDVIPIIQPGPSSNSAWESKLGPQDGSLISIDSGRDCAWEPKLDHYYTSARSITSGWPMDSADGPPGASTIFWSKESVWWITEAVRDWRRAAWHGRMRLKWEQAASSPWLSVSPDPTEP
jgi:hypothetical protein